MHKDTNLSLSPYEWPEFRLYASYPKGLKPQEIPGTPIGARWGVWPFYFEEYRSDTEPNIHAAPPGPNRLVIWQRPTRTDIPSGWLAMPGGRSGLYIGYCKLTSDYLTGWSGRAARYARHLRRNSKQSKYEIVRVSYETFAAAFAHSTVAREIPTYELKRLEERMRFAPTHVSLWGVRRLADGRIVAGLSAFESPTHKAGHYSCGFYLPEVRTNHLMIGLMDHWFADSLARGLKVLHFGTFVPPHSSGTRRGRNISEFKAQFVTDYLQYQRPVYRLVRGTLFRQ